MPGRDGSGPMGQGPFTGRGLGNCLAYGIPAIAGAIAAFGFGRRRGFGGGFGRGMGRGFGWRNFVPEQDFESGADELSVLKNQAKYLEENLKGVQERISDLEQK